jgi:hypothetical protein
MPLHSQRGSSASPPGSAWAGALMSQLPDCRVHSAGVGARSVRDWQESLDLQGAVRWAASLARRSDVGLAIAARDHCSLASLADREDKVQSKEMLRP